LVRVRLKHMMLAWCFWLLLAPLLVLQQPAQRSLGAHSVSSVSARDTSDSLLRPQHASLVSRMAHRDRLSGGNNDGPDLLDTTDPGWLRGRSTQTAGFTPGAICPPRDFADRRTAHPRAPPA
jgi:hypothetical protein